MPKADLGGVKVGGNKQVTIMGAINLSPDSFYGGSIVEKGGLLKMAVEMVEGGAEIIDVGAMGTGPKSGPIPPEMETRKLIPAVKALAGEIGVPVSADTQRAEVAEAAIGAGVTVINDISGLKGDPGMADVIADNGCSALLMAAGKAPGDVCGTGEIKRALRGSLGICREHGIPWGKVVLDPAVGYWPARLARIRSRGSGRNLATLIDLRIISELGELKSLGRPLCVGISRKSFVGDVLGLPHAEDRLTGSLSATVVAVLNGADMVRTHDPAETLHAVRMAEAIMDAGEAMR